MSVDSQIFNTILHADAVVGTIYVILIFFSIWSWSIIFDKFFKFRLLRIKTDRFDKLFWSGVMLEDIYKQVRNSQTYPSAVIFSAAMQEWESTNIIDIIRKNEVAKKESLKERLVNTMDVALVKSMTKIKFGLTFLEIVSSTGTLFGIFGTVWELIIGFNNVAQMADSSLVVLAPSISSSFITTIFGLIASVPASIAYINYSTKINDFEDKMSNFCSNVLTILSRELDQ